MVKRGFRSVSNSFSILTTGSFFMSHGDLVLVDVASHLIVRCRLIELVVESAATFCGDDEATLRCASSITSSLILAPNCFNRFSASDVVLSVCDNIVWRSFSERTKKNTIVSVKQTKRRIFLVVTVPGLICCAGCWICDMGTPTFPCATAPGCTIC